MNELLEFAKLETGRIKSKFNLTNKELTLATTIKLGEEVGELNREVLKHFGYARKKHMEMKNELSHEIADVMITSSIVAQSLNIDIGSALKEKMEKITKRY